MNICVVANEKALGSAAAAKIVELLNQAISERGEANYLVSTGASQFSTFEALLTKDMDWSKVTMFHLDEYVGLPVSHKASFQKYLRERFADRVNLKRAVFVSGLGDLQENLRLLEEELAAHPIDVGAIGIGENGHIAFNDPHVADFMDTRIMKVVDLDEKCRMQQVHDGCFHSIAEVPSFALTLTVPALMSAGRIFCIVPSGTKSAAVRAALYGDISESCPASILRTKPEATLYLDKDSSRLLDMESLKLS